MVTRKAERMVADQVIEGMMINFCFIYFLFFIFSTNAIARIENVVQIVIFGALLFQCWVLML